jgi:excisionase family DNA binding protein
VHDLRKQLYRPDEVAALVRESRWTVYAWIRSGKLKAVVMPGGRLRIDRVEIARLMSCNSKNTH